MTMEFSSQFPARASAPGRARSWSQHQLESALGDHPGIREIAGDAAVVVSELMTNAIRAGSRTTTLTLTVGADHVRIGVTDDAGGRPQVGDPGPSDQHGRGLQIVDALCTDWGVRRTRQGKQVWAELPI